MSVTGLTVTQRIKARSLAVSAARLALKHAEEIHYTQSSPARWDGINYDLKAWRGQYPTRADCSSFNTWCLWCGLDHYGVDDVVNGADWCWGNTATMVRHGSPVANKITSWLPGDIMFYGDPEGPTGHVAIYEALGKVISHGSEAGPVRLSARYRPIVQVRRYIR